MLPVECNFKEPLWFTHCCLTCASLYPHITETKTMFSNGRNAQALRLQQFTRTISKFRNRVMAIRCKPCTNSQKWVEPNQAVSRINVATLGIYLDPVYQRMQKICFFDAKFHKFDFFRDSWRQKIVRFFRNIGSFLEAVGTCYQTGVFTF